MTHESKLAGNKTSRGLCPKCERKACIDCLAGQNDHIWLQNGRYSAIYGSSVQPNNPCMLCGRISGTGLY